MARHGIPTARYRVCESSGEARDVIASGEFGFPVVLKADGLAAGKGVVVASDRPAAEAAIRAAMDDRQFGAAGARLVIEECLVGPEVSFFALCDGTRAIPITSAQDHKRIVTAAGRVLTVVGTGATYQDAIDRAYQGVSAIKFEGMQYRRDIGAKAVAGTAQHSSQEVRSSGETKTS